MSFSEIHVPSEMLNNHDRMLLLQRHDNPLFLDVVGYEKESGFTGATLMLSEGVDPLDVVPAVDNSQIPENAPYALVNIGLHANCVASALGRNLMDLEKLEPSEVAYKAFLESELLDGAKLWLESQTPPPPKGGMGNGTRRSNHYSRSATSQELDEGSLNYLCSGNKLARTTLATMLPISYRHFAGSKDVRDAIDSENSKEFFDSLTTLFSFTRKETRTLVKLEKLATDSIDNPSSLGDIHHLSSNFSGGDGVKMLAKLNSSQFPADIEAATSAVNLMGKIKYHQRVTGLGSAPYKRYLKNVKSDEWTAKNKAFVATPTNEQMDYLRSISKAIQSVIVVGVVRDVAPTFLNMAEEAANKIWSKQEPDKASADALLEYLRLFQSGYGRGSFGMGLSGLANNPSILSPIGDELTLKKLDENTTRWHHITGALDTALFSTAGGIEWTPLVGSLDLGGSVVARELTSSSELKQQGESENHCVGGYTANVMNIRNGVASILFSIEEGSEGGKVLSTLEMQGSYTPKGFRKDSESPLWIIQEHKAAGNTKPCPRARAAAQRLTGILEELEPKRLEDYCSLIERNTDSLRDMLGKAVHAMGGNITNPKLPETILSEFNELLPKRLQGLEWQDWYEIVKQRDMKLADAPENKRGRRRMEATTTPKVEHIGLAVREKEEEIAKPDESKVPSP